MFRQQVLRSFEIGKWLLERKNKKPEIKYETEPNDINFEFITSSNKEVETVLDSPKNELSNIQNNYNDQYLGAFNQDNNQNHESKKKKAPENLICKICNKQCPSTNSYNRHIRTHDNTRPHVCCKCDKAFKTTQVLSEHMKRHYDDRRHHCELCSRKFYSKASLNDHLRSHTGEKPFGCEICGRAFGTKAILRQHLGVISFFAVL